MAEARRVGLGFLIERRGIGTSRRRKREKRSDPAENRKSVYREPILPEDSFERERRRSSSHEHEELLHLRGLLHEAVRLVMPRPKVASAAQEGEERREGTRRESASITGSGTPATRPNYRDFRMPATGNGTISVARCLRGKIAANGRPGRLWFEL